MPLLESLKLLKKNLTWVIAVPILCFVLAFGGTALYAKYNPQWSASATVVVPNGSLNAVTGIASGIAQEKTAGNVTVEATSSSGNASVTITAKGPNAQTCINAANAAANNTASTAEEQEAAKSTKVAHASSAKNDAPSAKKFGLMGFLGGLFITLCTIVAIDSAKRRIHDWHPVEELTGLPYLGTIDASEAANRLIVANLTLAYQNCSAPCTAVLIPAGNADEAAIKAVRSLTKTQGCELTLSAMPSLQTSTSALFEGRKQGVVAMFVKKEVTTYFDVEQLLREFEIAGITPAGFIYSK